MEQSTLIENKVENYTESEKETAKYFKILSHPARIAIINNLIKKNSCTCGDLVDELPLSQSTVSQHLKELKNAGLIKGDIEGASVCYCIDHDNYQHAKAVMKVFLNKHIPILVDC